MLNLKNLLALFCVIGVTNLFANTVTMRFTTPNESGKSAGTVRIVETKYGLLFIPNLSGFDSGIHGFHVHVKPDCSDSGMAALGHLDLAATNQHLGPYNDSGHLGDLPALYASTNGTITLPVLAPRLKHISQIKNHTLMIHSGGDNYADLPQILGGGNGRIACGVIKQ